MNSTLMCNRINLQFLPSNMKKCLWWSSMVITAVALTQALMWNPSTSGTQREREFDSGVDHHARVSTFCFMSTLQCGRFQFRWIEEEEKWSHCDLGVNRAEREPDPVMLWCHWQFNRPQAGSGAEVENLGQFSIFNMSSEALQEPSVSQRQREVVELGSLLFCVLCFCLVSVPSVLLSAFCLFSSVFSVLCVLYETVFQTERLMVLCRNRLNHTQPQWHMIHGIIE